MTDFLRHHYHTARETALGELAQMHQQNQQFADQNGGEASMPPEKRRIYDGRKSRIIRIVAAHDAAQEYIDHLEGWISDLIRQNQNLDTQVRQAADGWQQHFPRITKGAMPETEKEYRRHMTITRAKLQQPELY